MNGFSESRFSPTFTPPSTDGADIRKKIRKAYEKALRDLENSRRLLDRFHQADQPQFTRWLNSNFGALLTELRELNQKLAAADAIVILVQQEVLFGGSSYARAYQRVMGLKENPEPPPPRPGGSPEWDAFEAGDEWGSPGDEEELAEEFMNDFFGTSGRGAGPGEARNSRTGRATPAAPIHAAKRLKELYRAVVRRLHPDSQREMTAQKTEWWHQAQAAYEAGDAEQLEVILTLCEIGEAGTTAHTSASLLQRITAQVKSSLREIQRQLKATRREPAWNFSGRTDHAAIADRVGREAEGVRPCLRWDSRRPARCRPALSGLKRKATTRTGPKRCASWPQQSWSHWTCPWVLAASTWAQSRRWSKPVGPGCHKLTAWGKGQSRKAFWAMAFCQAAALKNPLSWSCS
ncbi:MAG: hypothetical protein NT154_09045 [Verrucomicrobia bacterium]|nr:hypothetical protein [Verrucomicrobiota bacterium]